MIPEATLRQIAEHSVSAVSRALAKQLLEAMSLPGYERLAKERDAARADAEQALRDGQEQTAGLHQKLAEVRAELERVREQRDEVIRAKTGRGLDDYYCCAGIDCGCMGVTVQEYELAMVDRAISAAQPQGGA